MTTTPSPIEQFIQKLEGYQRSHPGATQNTVIAMLKAAIEGLRAYAGCCDGCTCGDGWSHDAARETLAHLNTLAAEALGTTGEK